MDIDSSPRRPTMEEVKRADVNQGLSILEMTDNVEDDPPVEVGKNCEDTMGNI